MWLRLAPYSSLKRPFYKRQSCGLARCAGLVDNVLRERIRFLNATLAEENLRGHKRKLLAPTEP